MSATLYITGLTQCNSGQYLWSHTHNFLITDTHYMYMYMYEMSTGKSCGNFDDLVQAHNHMYVRDKLQLASFIKF